MKEAINNGHNGHIYGVKKQKTNDELNQTFPKTSITVDDKQESFDVPVVFIHSQVQILLKIHWILFRRGSGTFRHQPFGQQHGACHMGDKSVDRMG